MSECVCESVCVYMNVCVYNEYMCVCECVYMNVCVCACVCVCGVSGRGRGQSLERAPERILVGPQRPLGIRGPDLLQHLLMFLGKKVRSRLWSQRRTDRDKRELFGG